jgi:hypothetical protein
MARILAYGPARGAGVRRDGQGGPDELGAARLAEGRVILAELLRDCEGLSADGTAEPQDMAAAPRSRLEGPAMRAAEEWDVPERMARLSAEQLRCLLFALAERLAVGGYDAYAHLEPGDWFGALSQMSLGLAAGDVRLLAVVAEPGPGMHGYRPFELVVEQVEVLVADGALGAGTLADVVADQVLGWNVMVHHWYDADAILRASPAGLRERGYGLRGCGATGQGAGTGRGARRRFRRLRARLAGMTAGDWRCSAGWASPKTGRRERRHC